jgi:hypothetical protein
MLGVIGITLTTQKRFDTGPFVLSVNEISVPVFCALRKVTAPCSCANIHLTLQAPSFGKLQCKMGVKNFPWLQTSLVLQHSEFMGC